MHGSVSQTEYEERLRAFLAAVEAAHANGQRPRYKQLYIDAGLGAYHIHKLVRAGYITSTGHTSTVQYALPKAADDEAVKLMAMCLSAHAGRNGNGPAKVKRAALEPPPVEPLPAFMPLSQTEEISKHLAILANLLGLQFNGKTPPGFYQRIVQLEALVDSQKARIRELETFQKRVQQMLGKVQEP